MKPPPLVVDVEELTEEENFATLGHLDLESNLNVIKTTQNQSNSDMNVLRFELKARHEETIMKFRIAKRLIAKGNSLDQVQSAIDRIFPPEFEAVPN
jgi:hypothetical protein